MIINLETLFGNIEEEILLDEKAEIPSEYFENSDIKGLKDVSIKGRVYKDASNEVVLNAEVSGKMLLEDAISLEDVYYPFNTKIEENMEEIIKNDDKTIDILDVLWQNIVLEVPIRYTEVKDLSKFSGDGWKLIDKEDIKGNNPFIQLKEKMEEE